MRFLLSLFLGLAALTTPCAAVSASSALARLSARLAAAEQTLAQLQSQTSTETAEPTVSGWYNFDGGLWEDINGVNRATVFPDKAGNVALQSDNARGQVVFTRSASNTLAASYVSLPVGLNAPAFSLSTWISWGGFNQAGVNQATAISAANDNLLVTVGTTGALTVKVGSGTITGVTLPDDGSWTHITIVYDGATLALYRNGQPFSSVAAGGFPGSNTISLANNAARTAGYVGGLDDVQIYSTAMEDFEVNLAYDETRSKTTGFSSINDGWWGHYSQAKVVFANRVASQATGDIKFIGSFNDAELRPTNRIYVRLYGVTGTSTTTAGVVVNANNVDRVWWDNATMMLKIQTKVVFGQGQTFEFTIPASALNLINPAAPNAASSSDSRWIVAVALDQDQTGNKRQGLRYQGCFNTPATIVPNPSF